MIQVIQGQMPISGQRRTVLPQARLTVHMSHHPPTPSSLITSPLSGMLAIDRYVITAMKNNHHYDHQQLI